MELLNSIKTGTKALQFIFNTSSIDSFQDINFKDNSDLFLLYNHLKNGIPVSISDTLKTNEKINHIINRFNDDLFNEDLTNIEYKNILLIFCQKIANQLSRCSSIIKNEISPVVEDIRNNITQLVRLTFKQNNLGDLLSEDMSLTTDHLQLFNWDGIKSPSAMQDVVLSTTGYLKLNNDDVNNTNFNIVSTRIITKDLQSNFKDINEEDIDQSIKEKLENYEIFINKQKCIQYFTKIKNQLIDRKNIKLYITSIVKSMNDIKRTINNLKDEKLHSNANIILQCCNLVLFCCLFYKEVVFKESVLINKFTVNVPVFEKYKGEGIDLPQLVGFLRVYYNDKDIPAKGITVSEVLNSNVNEELSKINEMLLSKKKMYLKEYISKSFYKVMLDNFDMLYEHFNGVINDLDKESTYKEFLYHVEKSRNYIYGSMAKCEEQIYHVIVETFFDNTVIELMFEIHNNKLLEYLNTHDDTGKDDIHHSEKFEEVKIDTYVTLVLMLLKRFFIE